MDYANLKIGDIVYIYKETGLDMFIVSIIDEGSYGFCDPKVYVEYKDTQQLLVKSWYINTNNRSTMLNAIGLGKTKREAIEAYINSLDKKINYLQIQKSNATSELEKEE